MSNYNGYGRFIVLKTDADRHKYELLFSDITQFGPSVPFCKKLVRVLGDGDLDLDSIGKITQPHSWLDEHVQNFMPFELDNFLADFDKDMGVGEYAEVCGYLLVEDTSHDTDAGYEYDSSISLEKPIFNKFKLEDLKDSYYYTAMAVAEWGVERDGLAESETLDDVYKRLVKEGYGEIEDYRG